MDDGPTSSINIKMMSTKIRDKEIIRAVFTAEVLSVFWGRKKTILASYLRVVNTSQYLETRIFKNELARLSYYEKKFLESAQSLNYNGEIIPAADYVKELIGEL